MLFDLSWVRKDVFDVSVKSVWLAPPLPHLIYPCFAITCSRAPGVEPGWVSLQFVLACHADFKDHLSLEGGASSGLSVFHPPLFLSSLFFLDGRRRREVLVPVVPFLSAV